MLRRSPSPTLTAVLRGGLPFGGRSPFFLVRDYPLNERRASVHFNGQELEHRDFEDHCSRWHQQELEDRDFEDHWS